MAKAEGSEKRVKETKTKKIKEEEVVEAKANYTRRNKT